jgi:HlyD family secretion protein
MKPWQIALLVIVVVGGGFAAYNALSGAEEMGLSPGAQVVEVKRGALETTVMVSGEVTMTHQVKLTFDSSGTIQELNIEMGDTVKEGQILARLDPIPFERAVARAEANLRVSQINLEKMTNPEEADLAAAEAAALAARAALDDFRDAYSEKNLLNAEAAVRDAEVALENAQRALTITVKTWNLNFSEAYVRSGMGLIPSTRADIALEQRLQAIAEAKNNISRAEDALRNAEDDLAELKEGPDPLKLERLEAEVASTEARLATLKSGGQQRDIELMKTQVALAQLSLDEAKETLEGAIIVAPFDGVISGVGADVGDRVFTSAFGADVIALLLDPSRVEIDATADEIDIDQLELGQRAVVIFDALPGVEIGGELVSISPGGKVQAGVVSFPVKLSLESNPGERLKSGMSTVADVVTERKENILLVPNRAVALRGGERVVQVVVNGEPQERIVTAGISNDQWTEITSGLAEGERVLVKAPPKKPIMPSMFGG